MPTYTYNCFHCDQNKEVLCKISERDSQTCPKCGMPLQRKVDRPAWVWHPTSSKA